MANSVEHKELPRKPIIIDKQGRIVIPIRFREALGLPEGQAYPLWIEPYPSPENCKAFLISK